MEEYLKDTYGITVYQEQVMLLSQKLAGFTKGEADKLRKAMGKKLKDVLAEMKPKFIEGGAKKDTLLRSWRRFGKTGKLLPAMPLTNHILPVMRGLPTKQLSSRRTTLPNTWQRYSLTI